MTSCPCRGTTSDYWSVEIDGQLSADLVWACEFPTRQLPITGPVSFYNEKVDTTIDGIRL